ncbi:Suppressor of Ty 6-like protein [Aphelenchoides besseyi]|nr:Suppressor of Ty 6-like protein [Aphelenchoides besseyi]
MSHFIDNQAEESENDLDSDDEPVVKKKKMSKKPRNIDSSDEDDDEEEDDARAKAEMAGFVVDEDENEEEESDVDDNKSDRSGSVSDDLLDDDLDLVNENTGKHAGGRVEISDDEEDRLKIEREIFENDFEDDRLQRTRRPPRSNSISSRSSYDEEDQFIVHDDDAESRRRRHKRPVRNQAELQEAQEIFGFESEDVLTEMNEIFADMDEEDGGLESDRHEHTLIGVIEPEELAKHDTEGRKIIFNDVPERFQTRSIPVTKGEDDELKMEALWIQQRGFELSSVTSTQEGIGFTLVNVGSLSKDEIDRDAPDKIQEALNFIRNSNFEVPFIAFYRKEHVDSALALPDLWTIYEFDEKWLHFRDRKQRLTSLYGRMDKFIRDLSQLDEIIRPISDKNYLDLQNAQNAEEIMDCYEHFQLYYSNFLTRMVQYEIEQIEDPEQRPPALPKQTPRNDRYWNCVLNGAGNVALRFGLTAEQVAENFEYKRHHCTSETLTPEEVAAQHLTSALFPNVESVLNAAVYVMSYQLSREPGIRRKIREIYRNNAKLRAYPTKKGLVEIDENHPMFSRRYITEKPIRELEKTDYLRFDLAKQQNLLNVEIYIDAKDPENDEKSENDQTPGLILQEVLAGNYFAVDESTEVSMKWDVYRNKALKECVQVLEKQFARETHEILLSEAKDCVLREASRYFESRISPGKYRPTIAYYSNEDGPEDIEANNPQVRVIALAPSAEFSGETTAIALDHNGMVSDTCPVSFRTRFDQRANGNSANVSLRAFIEMCRAHRPHVIAIAASDMRASSLKVDVEKTIEQAVDDGRRLPEKIPVHIVTAEAAKVYAKSKMSEREFPTYNTLMRLAISVGRCLLDPLVEYAHLCNSDDDFLGIRIHPLQDYVPKGDLRWCYERAFINRVSEVGVDINYCIEFPHTSGVLQFVCGLGPQKANHIMQLLKHKNEMLDARSKLVTWCNLGPTIFVNAAGFIRIDVEKVKDRTSDELEQLDGSRVHPETYEWARKMAIDALEFEENNDATSAINEIIAAPDRLKDLDLDAFAKELDRQGFGNKSITLYDIRAELNNQYKDLREPPIPLNGFDLFKELVPNYELYQDGKLVHGRVQRIQYRKTAYDPNDPKTEPRKIGSDYSCPSCRTLFADKDYLTQTHMGTEFCRGFGAGVRVQLDDGVSGYIHRSNLSDMPTSFNDPSDIVRPGQPIACRVLSFQPDRLICELSCKTTDLQRDENVVLDSHFDSDQMNKDLKAKEEKIQKGTRAKTTFTKRVISHQSFHNVTAADAERMLSNMSQGEAIIRPSSKSINQLTVTWKVTEGIYQHVPIIEDKKKHAFDLGKELRINNEVFEDLDEILARYVTPLAEYVREVLNHKYFVDSLASEDMNEIEEQIRLLKSSQPGRIPYIFTASKTYPGKFVISYQLNRPRHEYFTATSEGFRFRQHNFPGLESMINWFKLHYRDPIPR